MTFDIRMGLKHVILQKLQNSCSHLLAGTSAVPKSHTDFSIEKILSDSVKDIKTSRTVSNEHNAILDLSKPSKQIPEVCNPTKQVDPIPLKRTQIGCEGVIKPKVLKFWDNNCYIGSNCSACELYYKNLNFNFNFTEQLNSNCLWTRPQNSNRQNINFPVQYVDQFHLTTKAVMSTTVSGRYNHFPIRDDEVSYKCQTCDKVFSCAYTLEAHEKTHRSPRYECSDCGKGFSQLRNYKYHLSVHRGTKEFAAECPECGKTFNDKGYLSSHMKIHRNKKEYECPYCPKSFNQRVAFNMHVRIHTGVKPHKCTECGKRFSRKMLLKQHMRTHSGEKPYQCSVCGKSFADRSNMTLHHRLHSGIKPFTCPICPKAFTKKHHLKTHLNYHTGCKPYVCPHPNCNQAFTQSSNMRTHAKKCQYRSA